jgi:hypothetical protein
MRDRCIHAPRADRGCIRRPSLVFVCVRAAKMTIGIANLPNQKHRKVAKQGARLNMLIVGPCAHTAVHPE